MSVFLKAAKEVLKMKKEHLHYKEITRIAIEKGLIATIGLTPEATMNTIILNDIKKKGLASDFVKIGNGLYGLKENRVDSKHF
jgi:hypothetical protein